MAGDFSGTSVKVSRFGKTVEQVQTYLATLDQERKDAEAYLAELRVKAEAHAAAKANRQRGAREDLAALGRPGKETKAKEKALRAAAEKKLKK